MIVLAAPLCLMMINTLEKGRTPTPPLSLRLCVASRPPPEYYICIWLQGGSVCVLCDNVVSYFPSHFFLSLWVVVVALLLLFGRGGEAFNMITNDSAGETGLRAVLCPSRAWLRW